MEDIIFRLSANYGFNDRHIRNIFVRGLVLQRLKAFIKLDLPADLAGTIQRAKQWEATYYEDQFDLSIKPTLPNRTLAHPLAYPPPTYMPQPALATTTTSVNVLPPPQVIPRETLSPEMKLMANKINELMSQLGELRVNQMGVGVKNDQQVDDRANVWCTNCCGQGHMKLDCPSPQALALKCKYCSGDHDISSCSRMINEGQQRNRNGQVN